MEWKWLSVAQQQTGADSATMVGALHHCQGAFVDGDR